MVYDNRQIGTRTKEKELRISQLPDSRCTPAGVRTLDTLIKSQVLYQLSYGCISLECGCKGTVFF